MELDSEGRAPSQTNLEVSRAMFKWGVGLLIAGTVALVLASNVIPFLPESGVSWTASGWLAAMARTIWLVATVLGSTLYVGSMIVKRLPDIN